MLNILCCKQPPKVDNPIIDFKKQTRLMEGRVDGARINVMNKSDELVSYFYPNVRTLHDLFMKGKELSKNGDCYGYKPSDSAPFKWLKYSEVAEIAQQIGSAFAHLGLMPGKEERIGIFARNRLEWVLTEQACNANTYVTVPLYDTLGDEAVGFILQQCELKLVVCDNSKKALDLIKKKSKLEHIVVLDEISSEVRDVAAEAKINIISFEELKEMGKKNPIDFVPPNTTNLALICYTSGTTGMPKGALLTHLNMVAVTTSVIHYLHKSPYSIIPGEQERYLSYLPLAHVMERCAQATCLGMGAKIGFFRGDIKLLLDDVKELAPTVFVTVPRLMNRIYSKVKENVDKSSALKKKIFNWAYAKKENEVLEGVVRNDGPYDFAFKAVRASLGGSVKIILTGSAPISAEVLHFMRVVSGCYVVEGYGATETGGASGMSLPGETTIGNVGPPFLCSTYKLVDVPEMGLVAARDNRGEICIAGTNIFQGYYKDPEKTKAALKDGWYHTGDIGTFELNGNLKIVDRVKNIFKLQQGEYIAPEKIENIYVKSKYVAQVFVYGDSLKSSLVAIVVPEEEVVVEWANDKGTQATMASLCVNAELKELILKDIVQQGKDDGLKGFEQVKKIHLHHELFSVEKGLLTPTMKAKRVDLKKYFQNELNELYSNLD